MHFRATCGSSAVYGHSRKIQGHFPCLLTHSNHVTTSIHSGKKHLPKVWGGPWPPWPPLATPLSVIPATLHDGNSQRKTFVENCIHCSVVWTLCVLCMRSISFMTIKISITNSGHLRFDHFRSCEKMSTQMFLFTIG